MIWILLHIPFIIFIICLLYDYNLAKDIISYSAFCAVGMLALILSLSPLKKLYPSQLVVSKLNKFRREIGVTTFSYASLHLVCFLIKRLIKDGGIIQLKYFLSPKIIPVIFIAYPILLILSLTSNQFCVKKLGFEKWKKLHKLVYVAQIAIFTHIALISDLALALAIFVPLLVLQLIRIKISQR